jgi:O-antigen/teichoic acid export membrane protein
LVGGTLLLLTKLPWNAVLLALCQGARIAGPGLAMVLLAAAWEPSVFGSFASHYAAASLIAFLPAAGLSAYILDQGARAPQHLRGILRFCDRLLIAVISLFLATGFLALLAIHGRAGVPFPLYGAMSLAALVEVRIAALRSCRMERAVATVAIPANLAILGAAAGLHQAGPTFVAASWLIVRVLQLASALIMADFALPARDTKGARLSPVLPFILSQSAGTVYSHADTLMVRLLLGETAAGLYNAALRLLQIASLAAQTLAQWFQPRLAGLVPDTPPWRRQRRVLQHCLLTIAVGGLVHFSLLGHQIVILLYGESYGAAAPVLMVAGALLAARCFVASQWMELTARQLESHRARHAWLLLAFFAALAWPFARVAGAEGVMLAHLLALAPVALLSGITLARSRHV